MALIDVNIRSHIYNSPFQTENFIIHTDVQYCQRRAVLYRKNFKFPRGRDFDFLLYIYFCIGEIFCNEDMSLKFYLAVTFEWFMIIELNFLFFWLPFIKSAQDKAKESGKEIRQIQFDFWPNEVMSEPQFFAPHPKG
jgi:hypothetical protein